MPCDVTLPYIYGVLSINIPYDISQWPKKIHNLCIIMCNAACVVYGDYGRTFVTKTKLRNDLNWPQNASLMESRRERCV
jgi:hypothetical protein